MSGFEDSSHNGSEGSWNCPAKITTAPQRPTIIGLCRCLRRRSHAISGSDSSVSGAQSLFRNGLGRLSRMVESLGEDLATKQTI